MRWCTWAMSECSKTKYIAPTGLHSIRDFDVLPSPCTSANVDLKYNRHCTLLFWEGRRTRKTQFSHICSQTGKVPSETRDSTDRLRTCPVLIVPRPRGRWELAGRGLRVFLRGNRGEVGDRTVEVSFAGVEGRDGEGG